MVGARVSIAIGNTCAPVRVSESMSHSAHRRMRNDVEAYLDGELSGADRVADVESHLAECADCRHEVYVLDRLKCSLRRLASNRPTDLAEARMRRWARRLSA